MQVVDSDKAAPLSDDPLCKEAKPEQLEDSETNSSRDGADYDSVIDVSGKVLDFPVADVSKGSFEGFYLYKNVINLIPRSVGVHRKLKTLKFFANEINLFPPEFGDLVELESIQVKISSPGLTGFPLHKLKSLKELELCKVPPRPSAFSILTEIADLTRLTKLSVCHFSIRYLPPEIGCLINLEYLDLSFNKMKSLPTEITYLISLISLKVAHNKLVELTPRLSSLQRLENLDLSNNRLTALGSVELESMHNLRTLNLQFNKLSSCYEAPAWISCNLEGNSEDTPNDESIGSYAEMDVIESVTESSPQNGLPTSSSSHLANSRSFGSRKLGKGWKRRYYLQQRARQERLNSSRKVLSQKQTSDQCKPCKLSVNPVTDVSTDAIKTCQDTQVDSKLLPALEESNCESAVISLENDDISTHEEDADVDNCSCVTSESIKLSTDDGIVLKSKRHPEGDLANPKPTKYRKPANDHIALSSKYSTTSFCGTEDYLPDGFYDAGRERPFLPMKNYEQNVHIDSREIILMDREKDEELDGVALCAQALVYHFKQINGSDKGSGQIVIDILQVASVLALFVSDHFGGSDKSSSIVRTRKSVSGSNYTKPFVCSCATGNSIDFLKDGSSTVDDIVLHEICDRSLRAVKAKRNSPIVPIGTLQYGVCRHRSLLFKYLCDRMEPRVPCELVRGYLDFSPHAWNVVVVKRGDSLIRMIVDACRPLDIREETDPEYFCRYVPLSRVNISAGMNSDSDPLSFPSLSECDEIGETGSTTLLQCKLGSVEAVAKVRNLEADGKSVDEIRSFEFTCIGEVRMLSALKHPCIVDIYGHQILSKWVPSHDGNTERRLIQSAILMEHVQGGSLKKYIEKLCRDGEKHVPIRLLLRVARDVAHALSELHSKDIIHRDIKSENIVISSLDNDDSTPVVKLCDFDRAIPLRSFLHTCCIGHIGIPPPDICVGTPRWMSPEVFRTMHEHKLYGLKVDIWSFGCLLFELLTLQVPYSGLPESSIHDLLGSGKRPQLTDELEALGSSEDGESKDIRLIIDLYRQCTEENPADRPTAQNLYSIFLARTKSQSASEKIEHGPSE
jgi:hypothetical protein